jgi:hypothetical protein
MQKPKTLEQRAMMNVGAKRNRSAASDLYSIAGSKGKVGSPLEGISRVVAALGGGYLDYNATTAEQEQRKALINALGGREDISPLQAAQIADGDKAAINTVMQSRIAARTRAANDAQQAKRDEAAFQRNLKLADYRFNNQLKLQDRTNARQDARAAAERAIRLEIAKLKAAGKGAGTAKPLARKEMDEVVDTSQAIEIAAKQKKDFDKNIKTYSGWGFQTGVPFVDRTTAEFALASAGTPMGKAIFGEDANKANQAWKSYRRDVQLIERHKLFGAALTKTESESWNTADINPSMEPETIQAHFKRRSEIMGNVMQKYINGLVAGGKDPNQISKIVGFDVSTPESVMNGVSGILSGENTTGLQKLDDLAREIPPHTVDKTFRAPDVNDTRQDRSSRLRARAAAGATEEAPAAEETNAAPSIESLPQNVQTSIANARAALARGADRRLVIKRFKDAGVDNIEAYLQ